MPAASFRPNAATCAHAVLVAAALAAAMACVVACMIPASAVGLSGCAARVWDSVAVLMMAG